MLERARAIDNIEFLTPYVVDEFIAGDDRRRWPRARCATSRRTRASEIAMDGAFIAIGHEPQSEIVAGQVETDDEGYVITEGRSTRTDRPGVFAAGDLVDHTYRQAVTAAGLGLPGRARRRVVPARHAAGPDARGHARGRPRRGAVGPGEALRAALTAGRPGWRGSRRGQARAQGGLEAIAPGPSTLGRARSVPRGDRTPSRRSLSAAGRGTRAWSDARARLELLAHVVELEPLGERELVQRQVAAAGAQGRVDGLDARLGSISTCVRSSAKVRW